MQKTTALRDKICNVFTKDDLKLLCSDLGVNYDSFTDNGIENLVDSLITHMQHRSRMPDLIAQIKVKRENVDWDTLYYPAGVGTATAPRKLPPELLPYQVDRKDQEYALSQAMERQRQYANRPLLCIVHGDKHQCLDTFCQYLYKDFLPRLPHLGEQKIENYQVRCPEQVHNLSQWSERFCYNLSEAVLPMPRVTTTEEINQALAQVPSPVFIHSHLWVKTFDSACRERLAHYLQFWDTWLPLQDNQHLFVFLFVQYEPLEAVKGWWKRRQYTAGKTQFLDTLRTVAPTLTKTQCVVLPPLENVTRQHVLDWSGLRELSTYCQRHDWHHQIHQFFDKQQQNSTQGLPLHTVAEHLTTLLTEG
jgi:hypothetical protein